MIRKGLGRGLDALLAGGDETETAGALQTISIDRLQTGKYQPRTRMDETALNELESHFGNKVYQTIVPRNVRLAEAPSYGKPVIAFDKNSKGAQAYTALAREILERVAP